MADNNVTNTDTDNDNTVILVLLALAVGAAVMYYYYYNYPTDFWAMFPTNFLGTGPMPPGPTTEPMPPEPTTGPTGSAATGPAATGSPAKKLNKNMLLCNAAWSNFNNAHAATEKLWAQYDIVLLDSDRKAQDVTKYTQAGKLVAMYISVGSREKKRSDASKFPANSFWSQPMAGWPDENWIVVEKWDALKNVMKARMQAIKAKGAQGVEFDNISIASKPGTSGGGAEVYAKIYKDKDMGKQKTVWNANIAYANWLADTAHSLGLFCLFKNGAGSGGLASVCAPKYDGCLVESALKFKELDAFKAFTTADKPVWCFEYSSGSDTVSKIKERAQAQGANTIATSVQVNIKNKKDTPYTRIAGFGKSTTPTA